MSDRHVWIKHDKDDDEVWVGLDTARKSLCLPLSSEEAEQLIELLLAWKAER